MKETKVLMSPREVSKEFGMTLNYVYSLCTRKRITSEYQKNGRMLIDRASVISYLQNSVRRPRNKKKFKTVSNIKNVPAVKTVTKSVKTERSLTIDFISIVTATVVGALIGTLLVTTVIK
jgi:hypothetical protein